MQKQEGHQEKNSKLIVFGSTRFGEEKLILDTIKKVRKQNPKAKFAIAPRHINKCREIENLLINLNLPFYKHSKIIKQEPIVSSIIKQYLKPGEIILIDTIGDLTKYYKISCISFVGGGFNPEFGGQNILEPAAFGKPVIFGPHMKNFEEEAELLTSGEGGIKIENLNQLASTINALLKNKKRRAFIGNTAYELVNSKRGAIEKHIQKIITIIS